MALYNMEMLGQERLELLLAQLIATVINMARGEDDDPATPLDFLPWWPGADAQRDEQSDEQSPAEMLAMVEMINVAFGGRDLRNVVRDGDAGEPGG